MKVLFIDGNHLMHRCGYAHSDLILGSQPVGAMYGFFRSLAVCRREFPLHHIVIAWDFGHKRRDEESLEGVQQGIIPEVYKGNRNTEPTQEQDLVRWQINQQWNNLRRGLKYTSAQQVRKKGFEADDVIATYVLNWQLDAVIMTSDQDYYQLLLDGVVMADPIKRIRTTWSDIRDSHNLQRPYQWVEVGALAGDSSDNIFGVPGVGIGTAAKLIAKHGCLDSVFTDIKKLKEEGKPLGKRQEAVLEHENRVWLAASLKLMDSDVDVPPLKRTVGDESKLLLFFEEFEFQSLLSSVQDLTI